VATAPSAVVTVGTAGTYPSPEICAPGVAEAACGVAVAAGSGVPPAGSLAWAKPAPLSGSGAVDSGRSSGITNISAGEGSSAAVTATAIGAVADGGELPIATEAEAVLSARGEGGEVVGRWGSLAGGTGGKEASP